MAGLALVLSGGGMFGAYQAGVWSELQHLVHPDIVIGASVGSLNGWAIAGGISGEELVAQWIDPARATPHRYRLPSSWHGGVIDSSHLEQWIQELHSRWTPRGRFGVALTRLWDLQPQLVEHPGVTWRHLAASCGVPVFLPQYRLDGRLYADGGLLAALPLWAAEPMSADRVLTVNLLGASVSPLLAAGARVLRAAARFRPPKSPQRLVDLSPMEPLGPSRAMIDWSRPNAERWIELGARAVRDKKHFIRDMF